MADVTRLLPSFSRRSFLRYTAASAGLLTLSRLRLAPAAAAEPVRATGLQVLTAHDAEVLTAIVERMVFTGTDQLPPVRETGAIETIDQALLQVDPSVQSRVRWLLRIFQWGPPLFLLKPRTFTGMSSDERDRYIRDWATSSMETRRLAVRALKNLSMLGYYSQDATWKAIHYDGPWAPGPRRIVISGQ